MNRDNESMQGSMYGPTTPNVNDTGAFNTVAPAGPVHEPFPLANFSSQEPQRLSNGQQLAVMNNSSFCQDKSLDFSIESNPI